MKKINQDVGIEDVNNSRLIVIIPLSSKHLSLSMTQHYLRHLYNIYCQTAFSVVYVYSFLGDWIPEQILKFMKFKTLSWLFFLFLTLIKVYIIEWFFFPIFLLPEWQVRKYWETLSCFHGVCSLISGDLECSSCEIGTLEDIQTCYNGAGVHNVIFNVQVAVLELLDWIFFGCSFGH